MKWLATFWKCWFIFFLIAQVPSIVEPRLVLLGVDAAAVNLLGAGATTACIVGLAGYYARLYGFSWAEMGISMRRWPTAIAAGFLGGLCTFVLQLAVSSVLGATSGTPTVVRSVIDIARRSSPWAVAAALATVFFWAAWEELVFRGFLYAFAKRNSRRWVAVFWTTAVFALSHGDPSGTPHYFIMGTVYCLLLDWTGTLAAPITAHMVHNLLAMAERF